MTEQAMTAQEDVDVLGVVDYLVIEVPTRGAAQEDFEPLLALVERGVIRVLDVEVVAKADDGSVALVDLTEAGDAEHQGLAAFDGSTSELLDDDDLSAVGELISAGSLGVVVIYEQAWTAALASALSTHGARLVATGQIHAVDLEAVLEPTDLR